MEDQHAPIAGDDADRSRIAELAVTWGFPPLESEAINRALAAGQTCARNPALTLGAPTLGDVTEAAIVHHVWTALMRTATRRPIEVRWGEAARVSTVDEDTGDPVDLLRTAPDQMAIVQEVIDRGPGSPLDRSRNPKGRWPLVRFHVDFLDHGDHLNVYRDEVRPNGIYERLERPDSLARIQHDLRRHGGRPPWIPDARLRAWLRRALYNALQDDSADAQRREKNEAEREAARRNANAVRQTMLETTVRRWAGDIRTREEVAPHITFLLRLCTWLEEHPTNLDLGAFADDYEREHGEPPPGLRARLLTTLGLWSCDEVEFCWSLPDGETILDDPRQLTDGSHDRLVHDLGAWVAGPDGTLSEPQGPAGDGGLRDALVMALASVKTAERREALIEVLLSQSVGVGRAQGLHRGAFGKVPSARTNAIKLFAQRAALEAVLHRHLFQDGRSDGRCCPCHRMRLGDNP